MFIYKNILDLYPIFFLLSLLSERTWHKSGNYPIKTHKDMNHFMYIHMAPSVIKLMVRLMFSVLLKSLSYLNKTAFLMSINNKVLPINCTCLYSMIIGPPRVIVDTNTFLGGWNWYDMIMLNAYSVKIALLWNISQMPHKILPIRISQDLMSQYANYTHLRTKHRCQHLGLRSF